MTFKDMHRDYSNKKNSDICILKKKVWEQAFQGDSSKREETKQSIMTGLSRGLSESSELFSKDESLK